MAVPAIASIDIVVVACDSGVVLEDCVARALDAAECASLTVVDNASSDGHPERLAARYAADPRFRLLKMDANLGFGAGCNRGAELAHISHHPSAADADPLAVTGHTPCGWLDVVSATPAPSSGPCAPPQRRLDALATTRDEKCGPGQAEAVLLLNPDCLIARDTLASLVAALASDRTIGLLGADVRDTIGREERAARRRDPTPQRLLAAHGRAFGLRGEGVQIARSADDLQTVDACSGALMVLPRAVWQRVGGFDERFFLHGEDLDLCRRVRQAGFRVAVANRVQVVHRQGSSSRARPLFVAWHKHLGLARYLLRYQPPGLGPRLFVVLGIAAMFLLRGLPRALFGPRG